MHPVTSEFFLNSRTSGYDGNRSKREIMIVSGFTFSEKRRALLICLRRNTSAQDSLNASEFTVNFCGKQNMSNAEVGYPELWPAAVFGITGTTKTGRSKSASNDLPSFGPFNELAQHRRDITPHLAKIARAGTPDTVPKDEGHPRARTKAKCSTRNVALSGSSRYNLDNSFNFPTRSISSATQEAL